MVRGWKRWVLVVVALGVFLALISPYIPDPLSIPGKNLVIFAIFLLAMFFPFALLLREGSLRLSFEPVDHNGADRLALICSRLC